MKALIYHGSSAKSWEDFDRPEFATDTCALKVVLTR
jgi:hypothetical protein